MHYKVRSNADLSHLKKIVMIFQRSFSPNAASSQRIYSLCDMCFRLGYAPVIVSCCLDSSLVPPSKYFYYFFDAVVSNKKMANLLFLCGFNGFQNAIKAFYQTKNISNFIIYSVCPPRSVRFIKRFARKNLINLVFDVVEFQNFQSQTIKSFFLYYLGNVYINKYAIRKNDNVFAISRYLFDFFSKKGCNVSLLPFVISNDSLSLRTGDVTKTVFLYAGFPGKKDDIISIIRGFNLVYSNFGSKFLFYLAGPSLKDLFRLGLTNYDYQVSLFYTRYLGEVSLSTMQDLYSQSDFFVLLKDPTSRRSIADYPSKIVQSLGHSLPVICNISSDLSECLQNSYNSFIVSRDSPESFSRSIATALQVGSLEKAILRQNAFKTSRDFFSIESYVLTVGKMLK